MKFQGVMLAQQFKLPKKPRQGKFSVEDKEDGIRILYLNGEGYTRLGNTYETVRPFARSFLEVVGPDVCVDAEMCGDNWNEASTLLKRIKDLDPKTIKKKIVARVFDVFRYDMLGIPYWKRRKEAKRVALDVQGVGGGHRFEAVKVQGQLDGLNDAAVQTMMKMAIKAGKEGVIVKEWEGLYVPSPVGKQRRSRFWLKQKLFKDITVTLVRAVHQTGLCPECSLSGATGDKENCSTCEGTGEVDKPDILGAWICKDEKGREVRCGSGYTLEQRKEHWRNRKKWAGRKMDVKVQDDNNDIVARHPVFLDRFRDDI